MSGQDDFWAECFDPAVGMPPNQFTSMFCNQCMNQDCSRSAATGTRWFRRVSTQEDRLFINPKFADPNDPNYREIANLDFRSALREALALEISDRRGDWSIPTEAEVALEASRVAAGQGLSSPPEPLVRPPAPPPLPVDGIVLRVTVKGQTADYEVTLNDDGAWACSCPAFKFARANPCRHIQQAEAELEQAPQSAVQAPVDAPPPAPTVPPAPPAPAAFRPAPPPPPGSRPPLRNIPMPSGGIMADGTAPPMRPMAPPPAAIDPWAIPADRAPPARGTIVPVGGKIVMGKKS